MRPCAEFHSQFLRDLNLFAMALTIVKSHTMDFIILLQSLNQTGGGVLASTEHDNGTFH